MSARRAAGAGKETVTFTFDGREMRSEPGQSIAAALLANGIRSWRTTRVEGRPRGLFCGIGVCFDCLVTVNGIASRRACLTEVRDGDRVEHQEGAGHADDAC